MVLFGTGSVAVAVLYNAHQGIFPIAIVWGLAVTLAIYMMRNLSNAHFNPAVSISMCATKRMTWKKLPTYLAAQFSGAFVAGLVIYLIFSVSISAFEQKNGIVGGSFDSVQTAKIFGEFYFQPDSLANIGLISAALAELLGTALLVFIIFLLTENSNEGRPSDDLAPVFIGLTVSSIIALIAPLTQAGLNPARDLSPRIVSMIFGWGQWAFPDKSGGFIWVYVLAPIVGGLLAGFFYVKIVEPTLNRDKKKEIWRDVYMKNNLILVGGFLGSGKTCLLWEVARRLNNDKKRVGLITNDQASELVDTLFLETNQDIVQEVSGSCFCCNFNGFIDAIDHIIDRNNSDIILAEPVGSCTDLSATILQPIKDKFSDRLTLRPLTVLADPYRLKSVLNDSSDPASYIIYKQFEEADVILINKSELLKDIEMEKLVKDTKSEWPTAKIFVASVKDGTGIDEWLSYVLNNTKTGTKILDIDYDIYAEGEAAFGWVNAKYKLKNSNDFEKKSKKLLETLIDEFFSRKLNVGHVKFLLQSHTDLLIGNITGVKENSTLRLIKKKEDVNEVTLIVNGRVETSPEQLRDIIETSVNTVFKDNMPKLEICNSLIPGRPNPTHRYNKVVE